MAWGPVRPTENHLVTGWLSAIDRPWGARTVSGANDCDRRLEGSGGMVGQENAHRLGWLGTGRMGVEMARRLLAAGCDLAVYNRSLARAEPLVRLGAKPAGSA